MRSKQQVSEKAKEVEGKLPVLEHQRARRENNPDNFSSTVFAAGDRTGGNRYKEKKSVDLGMQAVNRQGGGGFRDERNSGE